VRRSLFQDGLANRPTKQSLVPALGRSRSAYYLHFSRNVFASVSSEQMMTPHDFTRLLNAHGPPLILYARQWSAAPEDVVQEAFLKLVALRQQPHAVVPWLYKVVRHAAIDSGRTTRRRQQRERAVARPVRWFVEREVDGLDAEAAVAAVQRLPGEQREVIVARLWGGLSFEEIAEVAGCSASTAFRRFDAGIAALRKELGVPCPTPSPPA
jgi:RNA polymerase sigma factor (sigma-70 family)